MSSDLIEAIVLNVIPFQDAHQIATLFTEKLGICRVIGSYSRSPKSALFGILTPLHHVEVIFRPSKGDLLKIESASILNPHSEMRRRYDLLTLGCALLNSITKSQLLNKPDALLFKLLKSYLHLMIESACPEAILASFQLKLLRHEGLLHITNTCGICGNEPKTISIEGGKTVCASHASLKADTLTESETAYFYALSLSTSLKLLKELEIQAPLCVKVSRLFDEQLDY